MTCVVLTARLLLAHSVLTKLQKLIVFFFYKDQALFIHEIKIQESTGTFISHL